MEEEIVPEKKSKLWLWVVLVLLIAGIMAAAVFARNAGSDAVEEVGVQAPIETETSTQAKTWSSGQVAIAGKYADAEVVKLDDGPSTGSGQARYRMYYAAEPEIANFKAQVYSAISVDGRTWTEEGEILQGTTFPDLVKLPDNRWRMYFQNSQVIKSATSTDGLKWTNDAGIRIDKNESGYAPDSVGSQSTIVLPDGSYLMVYSGTEENKKYGPNVPNNKIANFFSATSVDGISWQKQGIAINSQNDTLEGFADGAELVNYDGSTSLATGGQVRLYFWGYRGIYYSIYENGRFGDPVLDYRGDNIDETKMYSPNPPSDPTLIKIDDIWHMYYGQHEKGIYYTTSGD